MNGLNKDDIIRMALEAGFDKWESFCLSGKSELDRTFAVGEYPCGEEVFKLAELVEAAIDNKYPIKFTHEEYNAVIDAAVADGAKMERERIAKQFDSGVVNVRARGQSKPEQLYRPFGLAVEANLKEKNT
jgi:hypothetical protein